MRRNRRRRPSQRKTAGAASSGKGAPHPKHLGEISLEDSVRLGTGMEELDRVLGGGIMQGSLVLVGGDPGIGKSTLLLQMCRNLASAGEKVLYISGEESLQQIRIRADRMGRFPIPCCFCARPTWEPSGRRFCAPVQSGDH